MTNKPVNVFGCTTYADLAMWTSNTINNYANLLTHYLNFFWSFHFSSLSISLMSGQSARTIYAHCCKIFFFAAASAAHLVIYGLLKYLIPTNRITQAAATPAQTAAKIDRSLLISLPHYHLNIVGLALCWDETKTGFQVFFGYTKKFRRKRMNVSFSVSYGQ